MLNRVPKNSPSGEKGFVSPDLAQLKETIGQDQDKEILASRKKIDALLSEAFRENGWENVFKEVFARQSMGGESLKGLFVLNESGLNNVPIASLWYSPKTDTWGVGFSKKPVTRNLSASTAKKMLIDGLEKDWSQLKERALRKDTIGVASPLKKEQYLALQKKIISTAEINIKPSAWEKIKNLTVADFEDLVAAMDNWKDPSEREKHPRGLSLGGMRTWVRHENYIGNRAFGNLLEWLRGENGTLGAVFLSRDKNLSLVNFVKQETLE
jgi:hypothetical protein